MDPIASKFFLPVDALAEVFRGKFIEALKELFAQGQLGFHGSLGSLRRPKVFAQLVRQTFRKKWVVYCKRPLEVLSMRSAILAVTPAEAYRLRKAPYIKLLGRPFVWMWMVLAKWRCQMSTDTLTKIKLSVWRDFVPSKVLVFRQSGDDRHSLLSSDSDLQQEIYTWNMKEDPFGGVVDETARMRLRELLVDRFEASQAPAKRRVDAVAEFLAEAEKVIDAEQAEWTVSQDGPLDDDDFPYRLNPLLALKLHLEWLMGVFGNQPGISVSVR